MAEELGIGKVSGIPIADVGKMGVVAKANAWSKNGEQRQQSLFRSLIPGGGLGNYGNGKNSASFSAQGGGRAVGYIYFQFDQNDGRITYNFNFSISGITASGLECAVSTSSNFSSIVGRTSITSNGANSINVAVSDRTTTVFIGIYIDARNTDSFLVSNLLLTT